MGWQGVPFLLQSSEFVESKFITLNKIPLISVDTGFGWDTFTSTVLAGLITGGISWYAIRSNNKTLKQERDNQERLAKIQLKAQFVSVNRQQWINELRDAAAMYISGVAKLWNNQIQAHNAYVKKYELDSDEINDYKKQRDILLGEMSYLVAKITMLLNPSERESSEVIDIISDIAEEINGMQFDRPYDSKHLNDKSVDLKDKVQCICKMEWEKIKSNE